LTAAEPAGKGERLRITALGELVHVRTARIRQAQQSPDLVESLPGGIVEGLPEFDHIGGDVPHVQQAAVPAGDDQGEPLGREGPARPGPAATAPASTSAAVTQARRSASSRVGPKASRWALLATSGTIPPNRACSLIEVAVTSARSSWPRTSAIPVSSQDVSIP